MLQNNNCPHPIPIQQNAGPDIQWIDAQRPLFTVATRLHSTVLSTDQHLHNLFAHIDRVLAQPRAGAQPPSSETCKILKAAHAMQAASVIAFLPTLLNQLFHLLVHTAAAAGDEVGLNVIRLLVNLMHTVAEEAGRGELLAAYVKYVFQTANFTVRRPATTAAAASASVQSSSAASSTTSSASSSSSSTTSTTTGTGSVHFITVHGELCRHLPALLHPTNTDFLLVNRFMRHSGHFFDLIVKSMAQHLLGTGRIRMLRHERLPAAFAAHLEQLVHVLVTYLHQRHAELPAETAHLNRQLAAFLQRCLSYMDRQFVFRLLRHYLQRFRAAGDARQLHEFKFAALAAWCAHEHYVPLCLPLRLAPADRLPDILRHFTLSEEFCRQHYLCGVLLQEVRGALREVSVVRSLALRTLRQLVGKHELDGRYQQRGQLERIAMLYVPWLGVVLANAERLAPYEQMGGEAGGGGGRRQSDAAATAAAAATPTQRARQNRVTLHLEHPSSAAAALSSPLRSSLHMQQRDAQWFAAIAGNAANGGGHGGLNGIGIGSTTSLDSPGSSLLLLPAVGDQPLGHTNGTNGGPIGSAAADSLTDVDDTASSSTATAVYLRSAAVASHQHQHHNRSVSTVTTGAVVGNGSGQQPAPRCDKLTAAETRDALAVFLFVVKHVAAEQMVMWWRSCSEAEQVQFFAVLEMCVWSFRYVGRKNVRLLQAEHGKDLTAVRMRHAQPPSVAKASTLPARIAASTAAAATAGADDAQPNGSGSGGSSTMTHTGGESLLDESARANRALHESNLATEVGLCVLDSIGLYTLQFRDRWTTTTVTASSSSVGVGVRTSPTHPTAATSQPAVLVRVAGVYLRCLQLGPSETLARHVFAALRAFINNFAAPVLFRGPAALCGRLCAELLRCCDSRLQAVRQDACAVLYLLMRSNFEFSARKGLTRVHLQVIIAVSQMLGTTTTTTATASGATAATAPSAGCSGSGGGEQRLNNARFQESLSLINSYASSDKAMRGTGFPGEVKDLTRRVRTVLMATAQMQAHQTDPERLLELQLSLAHSYAATPELRHTWLQTMARHHERRGDYSEAASCQLHIAALMAEYLQMRGGGGGADGEHLQRRRGGGGCCTSADAFARISPNIARDEKGLKLDTAAGGGGGAALTAHASASDSQYSEQQLLEQLRDCAELLDRAERWECLGELYRLIVPVWEERRDFGALAAGYEHLAQAYAKVAEAQRSGRRLLGRYYRVAFFGQAYFEEEHGVEYVYKEPKCTALAEISERLQRQFAEKFGADAVRMVMDSAPVRVAELDARLAYVQITHVTPWFCKDELEWERQTDFEQNHVVDTFAFETPFTRGGGARSGAVEEQWKRRTILTSEFLTRIWLYGRIIPGKPLQTFFIWRESHIRQNHV